MTLHLPLKSSISFIAIGLLGLTTACGNSSVGTRSEPSSPETASEPSVSPKQSIGTKAFLSTEPEKRAFLENCIASASKGGNASEAKVKNYCECSLKGFTGNRVTDADLSNFLENQANADQWPEVITNILTECAQNA